MGNRAVITSVKKDLAVYMHWNGGRDSVQPILDYCKMKGYRAPENDNYGWARLAQVIGNFFGGTNSVGIGTYASLKEAAGGDNGVYIIKGWEIVGREDLYDCFVEQDVYDYNESLKYIDQQQPEGEQLGEYLDAHEVATETIEVGDTVFMWDFSSGNFTKEEVIGIGEDRMVNGRNVLGVPYVGKWALIGGDVEGNPNNYLHDKTYRVVRKTA